MEADVRTGADIRGTDGGSVTVGLPPKGFGVGTVPNDPQAQTNKVYFLYCAGFVKIGHTNRLMRRFSEMKISSPFSAQIIFLIAGGRLTEDYLHFIFDEYRVKGEWFQLGPRLRETIEQLAPEFCLDWLREDEENHRLWIAEEAQRLGLLPPSRGRRV